MPPALPSSPAPWTAQRLNLDATWRLRAGGVTTLFDPWLLGSEVDGVPWFHRAWHTGPVTPPERAGTPDLLVISQPFADHCHPETLRALGFTGPVLVVPPAAAAVRKALPDADVRVIPQVPGALTVEGLDVWRLSPPWWHLTPYQAIVLRVPDVGLVVHAPHGLRASVAATLPAHGPVALLATSRVGFRLPLVLGGAANLGPEVADAAARACAAAAVLPIHDEAKRSEGLVPRLARVDRRPLSAADPAVPWIDAEHLDVITPPAGP